MPTEVFPLWVDELRQRYLRGESSVFVVHGNVRDFVTEAAESLTVDVTFEAAPGASA